MAPPVNGTEFDLLLVAVNNATDGYFGLLTLIAIWSIIFFGLKWGTSPEKSATAAFFVTTIVAIIYVILGITTWYMVTLSSFFLICSVAASYIAD